MENEIFSFFNLSIFKILMSITHFRPAYPYLYISDFLMFRTVQSQSNATMGGQGLNICQEGLKKNRMGGFLFPVRVP